MVQGAYDGDEMFWYKTSMLMVEATLKDYENRKGQRIVSGHHHVVLLFSLLEIDTPYPQMKISMHIDTLLMSEKVKSVIII